MEVPAIPPDPALPGARGLFLEGGVHTVAAFLEARGWSVAEARPVQALYRPGRSCVVRYRVVAATARGEPRVVSVCAESRAPVEEPPSPGPDLEERSGLSEPVGFVGPSLVWAFPYDPSLPGLADAAWGPAVRGALARHGEAAVAVGVEALRYRPRRRAVFRYVVMGRHRGARSRKVMFGKVLRPSRAHRTLQVARALSEGGRRGLGRRRPLLRLAVPEARLSGDTLVFSPMGGRSLRDLLLAGGPLPSPERVARLPDDLARLLRRHALPVADRAGPVDLARRVGDLLTRLVPEASPEVRSVVEAVEEGIGREDVAASPVHGDLYEAQVFVDRGSSLGLIDLDDLGPGDPALDAANFLAHLLALALSVPRAGDRLVAYRSLVREAFLARLDIPPRSLAWREALAMLLLATGPFRVLDPHWPREVGRRVRVAVRLLNAP